MKTSRGLLWLLATTATVALFVACSQIQDVGYTDATKYAGIPPDAASDDERVHDGIADGRHDDGPTATCEGTLTACGATCKDLTNDHANCGRCGRVCNECNGGACGVTRLLSTFDGIDDRPNRLLVDANFIYWTSAHCVTRANKDGTASSTIGCPLPHPTAT